jgi:hypothetical protein
MGALTCLTLPANKDFSKGVMPLPSYWFFMEEILWEIKYL